MKHIIDLETFERKNSVAFFKDSINPFLSITSEVECTGARERAKAHGISFFLYYTHAMVKAANEIKEFKYRLSESGEICWYDPIHVLAIIRTGDNGAYNTIRLEYDPDLTQFARKAQQQIDNHPTSSNPFGDEQEMIDSNQLDVILISALPTMSFTSISFAHRSNTGGYPLTLIGKMITREGKEYIPIGINVHHGFVDGYHLEKYYSRVAELLKE